MSLFDVTWDTLIYHTDKDHIRNVDGPWIPGNKEAREDLKMELSQ